MKKILVFLFTLFVSLNFAFADDNYLTLLPWDMTKKEVVTHYLSNGWSFYIDDNNHFLHFKPVNKEVYYHNKLIPVNDIAYVFNADDTIYTQIISIAQDFKLDVAFFALTTILIDDRSILNDYKFDEGEVDNISYNAILPDCKAMYYITGKNDLYIVHLCYLKDNN